MAGVSKNGLDIIGKDFQPKNATDVFYKYKETIIRSLVESLDKNVTKGRDTSKLLRQSINVEIKVLGKQTVFQLEMLDYWKFINDGVDGTVVKHGSKYKYKDGNKPVNIGAMLKMIKNSGITPNPSKLRSKKTKGLKNKTVRKAFKQRSTEQRSKSLAYLLGISIKRKGIKPNHFADEVLNDDLFNKIEADLQTALQRDVELTITL